MSVAYWFIVLLDGLATGDSHPKVNVFLAIGSSALALSVLARVVYRRVVGVAAETEAWLQEQQRPKE